MTADRSAWALAPEEKSNASRWAFGSFRFDVTQGLCREDRFVAMGPKLQRLLTHLLEAAPDAVQRETLIRSVWQRDPQFVSRNVLPNAVASLRKTLNDSDGTIVQTVAEVGYRMGCTVQRLQATDLAGTAPTQPTKPGVEADRIIAEVMDAHAKGVLGKDPESSPYSVLRDAVARLTAEGGPPTLVLAALQERLAALCTRRFDYASASLHYRQALTHLHVAEAQPTAWSLRVQFQLAATKAAELRRHADADPLAEARALLDEGFVALASWPEDDADTHCMGWYVSMIVTLYAEDPPAALHSATEALRWVHGVRRMNPRQVWDLRSNCAVALFACGQPDQGFRVMQALLADQTLGVMPHEALRLTSSMHLGAMHMHAGEYMQAMALLGPLAEPVRTGNEAVTTVALTAAADLGTCLRKLGRCGEAVLLLRQAQQRALGRFEPSSEEVLEVTVSLANALFRQGERDEALRLLEAALEPRLEELRAPGQRYATAALAHYMGMLIEVGRPSAARQLLPVLERCNLWPVARSQERAAQWLEWLRLACKHDAPSPAYEAPCLTDLP